MKERLKIYLGLAGSRAKRAALTNVRFDIIALVAIASMALGVAIGYIQTTGFELFTLANNEVRRSVKTVRSWTQPPDPARPVEPARSQTPPPAPEPRPPAVRPTLPPGPLVPVPEPPSVASTSGNASVASAAAPVFRVQVGAFRIRSNAEVLVKQLDRDGFKASIYQIAGLHKVQIGSFRRRKEAIPVVRELKAKRYRAFITRAPSSNR